MPDETPPESLQSTSLLRGKTHLFRRLSNRYPASIHFPLAREDSWFCLFWFADNASIHFPLAREDRTVVPFIPVWSCFNPLPSCEGRLLAIIMPPFRNTLQSTSLLRGKTDSSSVYSSLVMLQSTSLLRGKTQILLFYSHNSFCFNPLPSCEGRRFVPGQQVMSLLLQSTSLLRGKTAPFRNFGSLSRCFNPLPSCEGRLIGFARIVDINLLQSTSLLRGKTSFRKKRS